MKTVTNPNSGGIWFKRTNINKLARQRKATSHKRNLIERAGINQQRSNNKANPNYHGIGYHALGKVRQQKRRAEFLKKTQNAQNNSSSTSFEKAR